MKTVKILLMFLLISAFMSLAYVHPSSAQTKPLFKVEPKNSIAKLGASFTVRVNAYDTNNTEHTDIAAYQICLKYDPAILSLDPNVIFGDFMNKPRIGWWGVLISDADAGQPVVNVADGSKYEPGYRVLIQDNANSEYNTVGSLIGNEITLSSNLVHSYTVVNGAGMYPALLDEDMTPAISFGTNRVIAGETTNGPAPGQNGDGWLVSFTFIVLAETNTVLDIDATPLLGSYTYIINDLGETIGDAPSGSGDPGNYQAELLKDNGYYILPWREDINGDGYIDIFDLTSVALWFGETVPPAPPEVDMNDDNFINIVDLTMVAIKYGQYAG